MGLLDGIESPSQSAAMGDMDPERGLIDTLRLIQQASAAPLIPQGNPLAQIAGSLAMMTGGVAGGLTGQPNPYMQQQMQARQAQVSGLLAQANVTNHLAAIQQQKRAEALAEKRETRLEQQNAKDTALRVATALLQRDEEPYLKAGLKGLADAGLLKMEPGQLDSMVAAAGGKHLKDRLVMTIGALDAGVDPTTLGIPLAGINIQALAQLTPEQRAGVAGPDYQKSAADLMDKRLAAQIKTLELSNMQQGIPKEGFKNPDDYAAHVALKAMRSPNTPLSPIDQGFLNQYNTAQALKGGTAGLAYRAAGGDKQAAAALALMPEHTRNDTEVTLYMKAGQIRAKMEVLPGYRPTLEEKGILSAADQLAERKDRKPLPQYLDKQFDSMRGIFQQLDTIGTLVQQGKVDKSVGPYRGRVGTAIEQYAPGPLHGMLTDPDRVALQTAVNALLAETGPDRFGGQFTAPEQVLVRDFLSAVNQPTPVFEQRYQAFRTMMERKYRDKVAVAEVNKFRIPDEYRTPSAETASSGGPSGPGQIMADKRKVLMDEFLRLGKSKEEFLAEARKRGLIQ